MRKMMKFAVLAGIMTAGAAQGGDYGIYATAGTIGLGGGVAANFGSHVGARLGYTAFNYDIDDLEESDLTFNGEAELGGLQALLDWYPFAGGLRISVGAVESARVTLNATPVGGTFTFDGVEYSAANVGEARGKAEFRSLAPYVGIGFGRALTLDGRFSFTGDIGVAFTGTPDITLSVTCNSANAMLCAALDDDAAAEQAQLQQDAKDYKYWPVLSFGVSYRF